MSFSKILIANRGEIACRVIRTAKLLGYQTVAVYSDADRNAPHVGQADEAVFLGASAASESYLHVARILEAARVTGADALHPGYGFLSENAAFAQAVLDAGLVFIGPPPSAILAMGDKALAKRRMLEAGVPCAPGYLGAEQADAVLLKEGRQLGFPLLVKAVAGGGGRGMRLVRSEDQLQDGIDGARREALSAFGDGTLMLERLIDNGRHIEIQVFADQHGNVVHLGERDCTAQRRRQKVIEEAPSPVVNAGMRQKMGSDAVAAAKAVGYRGAGTVEFIVDADLNHYFLEMNTRLQVEHPVTEMITGFDLVEWQLRVAAGEELPATQSEIRFEGHAIEARLYAEDPYTGFVPQTGKVLWWHPEDALMQGTRIDDGIRQGDDVSPFYDPMVAKIIVHGRNRPDAIRRLQAALQRAPLIGLKNNARFLADLVSHSAFVGAEMTTAMIDRWMEEGHPVLMPEPVTTDIWSLAAALIAGQTPAYSGLHPMRPGSVATFGFGLTCGNQTRQVRVRPGMNGLATVLMEGQTVDVQMVSLDGNRLRYACNGIQRHAIVVFDADQWHIAINARVLVFKEVSPFPAADAKADAGRARAPVAGKVTQIKVQPGDAVEQGQSLVCVEAMKMEMWLGAQRAGTVTAVHVAPGDQVASGKVLIEIQVNEDEAN